MQPSDRKHFEEAVCQLLFKKSVDFFDCVIPKTKSGRYLDSVYIDVCVCCRDWDAAWGEPAVAWSAHLSCVHGPRREPGVSTMWTLGVLWHLCPCAASLRSLSKSDSWHCQSLPQLTTIAIQLRHCPTPVFCPGYIRTVAVTETVYFISFERSLKFCSISWIKTHKKHTQHCRYNAK